MKIVYYNTFFLCLWYKNGTSHTIESIFIYLFFNLPLVTRMLQNQQDAKDGCTKHDLASHWMTNSAYPHST